MINKVKRIVGYIIEIWKILLLYPIAMILYGNKGIYLIAERGTDARDNGYHFFRYMQEKHKDEQSYYVICLNSADYKKVKEYENIVNYRSLRHYLLLIASDYKISTHIMGYSTDMNFYLKFGHKLLKHGKRIFLQHGIIKDDLPMLYCENTGLDMFCCGAKPEFEYVSENYHYLNNEVKYTGLARFDHLHNVIVKKQILIMPTWRLYLAGRDEDEVSSSEYARYWNEILNNSELIRSAAEFGYKIIFYPHYEMQKYIGAFSSNSKNIVIADFQHFDVQTLLKESSLLLTDYSSVFFDFAYMGKPIMYYQFDNDRFASEHYKAGYFDYEKMGFGPVIKSSAEVVQMICGFMKGDDQAFSFYDNRREVFFPLYDSHNCERIYEEMIRL